MWMWVIKWLFDICACFELILLHFNINWQWTQVSSVSRVMTGPEVSGCRWSTDHHSSYHSDYDSGYHHSGYLFGYHQLILGPGGKSTSSVQCPPMHSCWQCNLGCQTAVSRCWQTAVKLMLNTVNNSSSLYDITEIEELTNNQANWTN